MSTAEFKKQFITALCDSVKAEIIHKIPLMPEEWDGHELRRYIADKFTDCVMGTYMTDKRTKRYREYQNAIYNKNL